MTSKAEAIRELFKERGSDLSLAEIRKELKSRYRIEVTAQQVSNERTKFAERKPAFSLDDLPVSVLKRVKALVDEFGSTDAVRRALDELDELQTKGKQQEGEKPRSDV